MHTQCRSSDHVVSLDHLEGELDSLLKQQRSEIMCLLRDMSTSTNGPRRTAEGSLRYDSDSEDDVNSDSAPGCEGVQSRAVFQSRPMAAKEMRLDLGQSPDKPSTAKHTLPAAAFVKAEERRSKSSRDTIASEISLEEVIGARSPMTHQTTSRLLYRQKKGKDWRSKLLRFTADWRYELANSFIILINAVLIAWETEYSAHRARSHGDSNSVAFDALTVVFCFIYAADLCLRVAAQGSFFFRSLDWKWNLFDSVVVFGSILEVIAFLSDGKDSWVTNASLFRVVRLLRVVRIGRAFRSMVYFRELRITISMLCDALIPMVTFASIMAMIFMVFGIFFADGATAYVLEHGEDVFLSKYYGSLTVSMTTLYKAISGGMDWENAAETLEKLPSVYLFVFYAYVTFSTLALLNVVNAIFVDQTINRSKNDREYIVQTDIQEKKQFFNTMDKLFEELDPDRSGTINIQELKGHIMNPQVNAYFRAIGLNVYKVKKLFHLMDTDNSGEINKKEFAQGCTCLKGEAKQLDVAILQYEVKQLMAETYEIKYLVSEVRKMVAQKYLAAPLAASRPQRDLSVRSCTVRLD